MKKIIILLLTFNILNSQDYYLEKSNNELGGVKDNDLIILTFFGIIYMYCKLKSNW